MLTWWPPKVGPEGSPSEGRSKGYHISLYLLFTGRFIAIASTTVETGNPLQELEPAIKLLGNHIERFDSVRRAGKSEKWWRRNKGHGDGGVGGNRYGSRWNRVSSEPLHTYVMVTF